MHQGVLQGHTVRVTAPQSVSALSQRGIGRLTTVFQSANASHIDESKSEESIGTQVVILSLVEAFALQLQSQLHVSFIDDNTIASTSSVMTLDESRVLYSELNSRFAILLTAYLHLSSTGRWAVRTASKYGADFALYAVKQATQQHSQSTIASSSQQSIVANQTLASRPMRRSAFKHSAYLVMVRNESEPTAHLDLLTLMRVARSVQKRCLVCRVMTQRLDVASELQADNNQADSVDGTNDDASSIAHNRASFHCEVTLVQQM